MVTFKEIKCSLAHRRRCFWLKSCELVRWRPSVKKCSMVVRQQRVVLLTRRKIGFVACGSSSRYWTEFFESYRVFFRLGANDYICEKMPFLCLISLLLTTNHVWNWVFIPTIEGIMIYMVLRCIPVLLWYYATLWSVAYLHFLMYEVGYSIFFININLMISAANTMVPTVKFVFFSHV